MPCFTLKRDLFNTFNSHFSLPIYEYIYYFEKQQVVFCISCSLKAVIRPPASVQSLVVFYSAASCVCFLHYSLVKGHRNLLLRQLHRMQYNWPLMEEEVAAADLMLAT